jgi:ATP/maltotriose-dependent transcriptional regulator MalT
VAAAEPGAAHSRERTPADELLASQDYEGARAAFEAMVASHPTPASLSGLAAACRALNDIPAAIKALEQAYRLQVDTGDAPAAAVTAYLLADVIVTELGGSAVASGWLARARHHLRDHPNDPTLVLVNGMDSYLALAYDKDPERARDLAEQAHDLARRLGDVRAQTAATGHLGLIDVTLGRLREGLQRLDEATAAAAAGELPPAEAMDTYCLLITACERIRDFDRVDQWAQRVLSEATRVGSDAFATFARTQYANVAIWRGRWDEAERELDRVLVDAAERPLTAAMAMVLRAQLRRRQGRLDDAAAELAPAEREPYRRAVRHLVLAARAALELDRGDAQAAADLAERYLRAVSQADRIERVEALEVLLRARLVLGEVSAAEQAAAELEATAEVIPTDGFRASALTGRALVLRAAGDLDEARERLDEALALTDAAGLPHETVRIRLLLAEVLLELGRVEAAGREAELARDQADELGAAGEVAAADRILAGLRGGPPADDTDLTRREVEILRHIASGASNAEIAEQLFLSIRTVERHVSNIYMKIGATGPAARTTAVAYGRRAGLV